MKMVVEKNRIFLLAFACLLIGLAGGLVSAGKTNLMFLNKPGPVTDVRAGQGKFTNPLLECDQAQGEFTELTPFKDKISLLASNLQTNSSVNNISLYFQDLNNGPWFGVNSSASFAPASLLKVPLAIAYYKLAETKGPDVLQKSITYTAPQQPGAPVTQTIAPLETLVAGQSYTIQDLIARMLKYSDNQSYYLLFSNIDVNFLLSVYSDFGMQINGPGSDDDSIVSVRNYSSFFRILFNASYLTQADSEKVLGLLASSEFKDGLIAGTPANVTVSHKFGERENAGSNQAQLSDCGIIYYPQHPYLLCISTKGVDLPKQASAIQKLSAAVYGEIDNQYNQKY